MWTRIVLPNMDLQNTIAAPVWPRDSACHSEGEYA